MSQILLLKIKFLQWDYQNITSTVLGEEKSNINSAADVCVIRDIPFLF